MRLRLLFLLILWLPLSGCAIWEGYKHNENARELEKNEKYDDAELHYLKSIEKLEGFWGKNHCFIFMPVWNLAYIYSVQRRFADAEQQYKRALAIADESTLMPFENDYFWLLLRFAELYRNWARFEEAEERYNDALKRVEDRFGPKHQKVVKILDRFAGFYTGWWIINRNKAEPLYKRAQAIEEQLFGPDRPESVRALRWLGRLYSSQDRHEESLSIYKHIIEVMENTYGVNHFKTTYALEDLLLYYSRKGRDDIANPLRDRIISILENNLEYVDEDSRYDLLFQLSGLYSKAARYDDEERVLRIRMEILKKQYGPDSSIIARQLGFIAHTYTARGHYEKAEQLFKHALAIVEKTGKSNTINTSSHLRDLSFYFIQLASIYYKQDRFDEAEHFSKKALAIEEKVFLYLHKVHMTIYYIGNLYWRQGRYTEAEPLFNKSLEIQEKTGGSFSSWLASSFSYVAKLHEDQGFFGKALDYYRRSTSIEQSRMVQSATKLSTGFQDERRQLRYTFMGHLNSLFGAVKAEVINKEAADTEAFSVAQLARTSDVAGAIAKMAARFAVGKNTLAGLVREHQNLISLWIALDEALDETLAENLSKPFGARNLENDTALRAQIDEITVRLGQMDVKLTMEFPEYKELTSPQPMSLADAQSLLGSDEALVAYLGAEDRTFLWVVRKASAEMKRLDIGRNELTEAVAELRGGLDPVDVETVKDIPPFDTTKAFEIYQKIFAPAEPLLKGVRHVFVIPDGALQSLPLGVLVTEKPQGGFTDFSGYRQVPWLARKYAMTTLPSVSSLRALRRFAKAARGSKPFGGFGDPLLKGHPDERRGIELASLFKPRG
ncbi:MAG TPA: tetratricopeptide repeat protein, partial [Rhodospirillaceae bacterium]|nr:tetratricopeptide repeat protein [Rhodospirillaceae bacterium]